MWLIIYKSRQLCIFSLSDQRILTPGIYICRGPAPTAPTGPSWPPAPEPAPGRRRRPDGRLQSRPAAADPPRGVATGSPLLCCSAANFSFGRIALYDVGWTGGHGSSAGLPHHRVPPADRWVPASLSGPTSLSPFLFCSGSPHVLLKGSYLRLFSSSCACASPPSPSPGFCLADQDCLRDLLLPI